MDASGLSGAVRAFVDTLNNGEADAVEKHLARDYYRHRPGPDEPTAVETWADVITGLRAGFPDLRVRIDELEPSTDGELSGRVTLEGTQTGRLWGVPPTGATVRWQPKVRIREAEDGRFALTFDEVSVPEMIGLFREMELVNPPDEMHLPPHHPESMMPEFLLRVAFNGQVADRPCSHLDAARVFDSDVAACDQCVASGDTWPSLRLCMTCGFVGCCDTSVNTHMKRHAEETGHVLMRSLRLTEGWMWCYADNAFFDSRTLSRLRARAGGTAP